MKDRMTLKKELKAIAQSTCKMDTDIYNYFMNNVYKVGFNDREIVYLIWDLLNGYYYEKEDLELYVADFLLNETTIKNHTKFNELYVESYVGNFLPSLIIDILHLRSYRHNHNNSVFSYYNYCCVNCLECCAIVFKGFIWNILDRNQLYLQLFNI